MSNAIGNQIRVMRLIRGLTLDQLADKIAEVSDHVYTANAIGAWERGERIPSAEVLKVLCMALHCDVDSIVFPSNPYTDASQRVHSRLSHLSSRNIDTIDFLVSRWLGDMEQLLEFNRAYAVLPKHLRRKMIEFWFDLYTQALAEDSLDKSVDVDAESIHRAMLRLVDSDDEYLRELSND